MYRVKIIGLCLVAVLAINGLAVTSAQAAPGTVRAGSATPAGATPAKSKVKGAKEYELCDSTEGCAGGIVLVFSKGKLWSYEPNAEIGGTYKMLKKVTYFTYEGGYSDGCYLAMTKHKKNYVGGWFCAKELREELELKAV